VSLVVRPLADEERAAGGAVAGRALSNNPTSRWVFGDDRATCLEGNLDLFIGLVSGQPVPLGALLGDHVVGVCGASPPDECIRHLAPEAYRTPPETIGPPGDESRVHLVWSLFVGHDLDERHWHVGPVGVEPVLQGTGVGGALMRAFGDRMDEAGEIAWLETDKPENVVFYRRAGYEVAAEVEEHGLTTWFMRRDPR